MTGPTPTGDAPLHPGPTAEPEAAGELEAVPTEPAPEASAEPAPQPEAVPAEPEASPGERPIPGTFSLEGRGAPGLYLVGWLGTALGGATLLAAIVSAAGGIGGLVLTLGGSLVLGIGLIAAAGAQAIERRGRADRAYRGPSPFLVFTASIPLSILATLPLVLLRFDASSPVTTLLSVSATGAIWLVLVGLTAVGTGALSWTEIGAGLAGMPPARIGADIVLGAVAALPVLLATLIVTSVLVVLIGVAPEGAIAVPRDAVGIVLVLIAAAVVAPVGEEIFYRGFATTAWARGIGPTAAIVRGGLFFALAHVLTIGGADFGHAAQAALVAFLARIPVGLALGWIFIRRGSLPAAIALHATFNAALVLIAAGAAA